jgi:4-hydroxy-3-methylbut-2-enyl diphosphate reductase IspH
VIRVQSIIRKHARQGFAVIIVGEKDHPEVVGLLGYAGSRGHVVASIEELEALPAFDQAILVAQTTQNTAFYETVRNWAARRHPHYKCSTPSATPPRSARRRSSSWRPPWMPSSWSGGARAATPGASTKLPARAANRPYHVESEADLNGIDIRRLLAARTIGISAGASTPNWVIRKVIVGLETMLFRHRSPFTRRLHTMMHTALLTNLIVAVAAGGCATRPRSFRRSAATFRLC